MAASSKQEIYATVKTEERTQYSNQEEGAVPINEEVESEEQEIQNKEESAECGKSTESSDESWSERDNGVIAAIIPSSTLDVLSFPTTDKPNELSWLDPVVRFLGLV